MVGKEQFNAVVDRGGALSYHVLYVQKRLEADLMWLKNQQSNWIVFRRIFFY